ncbi:hypothetical protein NKZ04_29400, partial [Sinorhizobium meliloti]
LPDGDKRSLSSMRRNDWLLQLSKLKPMGASHPPPPFPYNPIQPVRSGAWLSASGDAACRISKWLKTYPK